MFDTAILKSAQAEFQLEADFKEALNRCEFLLFFQPVVALASNRIAGFEALVRWQHPVRGLVSPMEFIPIAERTGFILPLGNWILREACLQLKAWQESLPTAKDVWVSVNLSSPQFNQPALVEQISEALHDVALEAHCLVLELTEGVAMENPKAVKGLLMQLRVMGARVALDDFGTGQSSLAYLHQFPADILKVDRSFIRDMESRTDVKDIVGAVTTLAHQLGLQVIAEGVENDEQLALVRALKCEYVQGFLYSRPVDKERAADLLRDGLPPRPGAGRHAVPALEARPEVCGPDHEGGRRLIRAPKSLYVGAAVLATLACAGVLARFTDRPQLPARSASQPALENPRSGAPAPAATPPASQRALESPGLRRLESAAKPPAKMTPSRLPAPAPTTYSLAIVHKHALGSCRGLLTVSRSGVAYIPEKEKDKATDAFTLKFNEFLYALSDDSLTIKSNSRSYRFKAADATGKDDNRSRLQQIVDGITRLRSETPGS
jgi:EAL domain-containing protein (putative c-di-GMP-specific phosphodiesterase class I)